MPWIRWRGCDGLQRQELHHRMRHRPSRRRSHLSERQQLLRLHRHVRQERTVRRRCSVGLVMLPQVQRGRSGPERRLGREAHLAGVFDKVQQYEHRLEHDHHIHRPSNFSHHRHRQLQLRRLLLRSRRPRSPGQVDLRQHDESALRVLLRGLPVLRHRVCERVLLRQ